MVDTPEPGNWYAIATFFGTLLAAVIAGVAGIRRGEQRANRGAVDGDPVGLAGGALFVDSKPLMDLVKEVGGIRRAMERQFKQKEEADDRARDAKMDVMLEYIKELKREE